MDAAHLDLDHENVRSILIVSEVVNDHRDHNNADSDNEDDDHDDHDDGDIYIMMSVCLCVCL